MAILMRILNFAIVKDFHENSVLSLIYLRAYENPPFWCLISTPYMYENLEFSRARSNMYKNNVTFDRFFSWRFWILQSNEFYTCILHLNFPHEFYTWIFHMNFTHEFYTWILQLNFTSGCKILIWLHQNFTPEFYTWILHMNFTQKLNCWLLHPFTFAWSNSWGFQFFI